MLEPIHILRYGIISRKELTYCEEEVLDGEVPELPAGQRIDEILFVEMLVGSCIVRSTSEKTEKGLTSRSKRSHSDIAEVPLFLSQEFGSLGVIGQEKPNENTDNDSGDTFEDESGTSV
jgi:hypothetical protein